ncbi:sorbitol dehydrogenase-like [Schistocerca cancellata]|uniref:sorbitol dehydrogenase-like n=1 Tax=Schistocerca cancellata TaxID=274614 RepID=UPI002118FEB9|nr:sorbitol dehydrogenase-like [Schistocerca cancellata]
MASNNLSAILHGKNDLRLEQRPIPEPGENEVLLRMACVGICGSDVHYLTHGKIGDNAVEVPMTIGHEASGVVAKVGPGVKHLKVGDRVAIEPGVPCRKCDFCKQGSYHLCPDIFFCGTPPHNGNLSQYYKHAADFCYKLPEHVSLEEGALLEPLSVGVHACRRAGVTLGSTVLILGAGPIGLVTLIAAKAMGAAKVLITDINSHRLEVSKKFGADYTLRVSKGIDEKQVANEIRAILGVAPDISIDCCGMESTVVLGLQATRQNGVVVVVGLAETHARIPLRPLFYEIDLRGIFRYCNEYPMALELVASGKTNVKGLITHNFSMKDTLKAFSTAVSGEGNPIKIMIHCNKD